MTRNRDVDRKANTGGVPDDSDVDPGDREDLRPDFDHFSTFRESATGLRDRIPAVGIPSVPVVPAVTLAMYVLIVVGAVSVGYGATSLAAAYGGVHASRIVAGTFAFAYGYVGLRIVDAVTTNT